MKSCKIPFASYRRLRRIDSHSESLVVGRLSDRMDKNTLIFMAVLVVLGAWVILGLSADSLIGLVLGALLLDLGIQSVHITNQTIIFEGNPSARNRINTVYMVFYFVGGAVGTGIGGWAWTHFQWTGVSVAGLALGFMVLLFQILLKK